MLFFRIAVTVLSSSHCVRSNLKTCSALLFNEYANGGLKKVMDLPYGTIFEIGISRISSAPQLLSFGINLFTTFFGTTVWML